MTIFQTCKKCGFTWCSGGASCRGVMARASRRHSKAVQAYTQARELYREYSRKNRPPQVTALYEAAKQALRDIRASQAEGKRQNPASDEQLLLLIFPDRTKHLVTAKVPDVGSVWPPDDPCKSYFVERVRKVDVPESPLHHKVRLSSGR